MKNKNKKKKIKSNININQATGYTEDISLEFNNYTTELINNLPCTKIENRLDEQTFGTVKINDELVLSCRCENIDCTNYENCMNLPNSKRIERNTLLDKITKLNSEQIYKLDESIFNDEVIKKEILPFKIETFTFDDLSSNYKKVNDITEIVEANHKDIIMINSSSESYKTHTIIKKLNYVLENDLITKSSNILVLCANKYTKSNIIEHFKNIENNILIDTIDSFATKKLFELNFENISSLNYDKRVEIFNNEISNINLSNYELVIFDEIHELSNQRAMMLLNILKKISCGIMLLGDKCKVLKEKHHNQSTISIDTTRLYNLLYKILPYDTKKFELIDNNKNNEETQLNLITENIREALLYKDLIEAKHIILKEFEIIETENKTIEKIKPVLENNETLAFLCKDNSDAEYVSSVLFKNKIAHNLLRNSSNKYSYNRWIADVLWDHCSNIIEKDDFITRFTSRINDDADIAIQMYELLTNFTSSNISIDKNMLLQKFLNGKELPIEFTNYNNQQIIVSTVANTKNHKFDNVYLVNFELINLNNENIRLDRLHEIYGALIQTKTNLKLINFKNIISFKQTSKFHSFRTFKKYNNEICTHFSIGDDIQKECFFNGTFKDVLQNQQYISQIVKVNDKVELILNDNSYEIYHIQNTKTSQKSTKYLGVISNETFMDFKEIMVKHNNGILPIRLYDLYISQISTIPQFNNNNTPIQLKNSNFSIGIEISGFAKIDFSN